MNPDSLGFVFRLLVAARRVHMAALPSARLPDFLLADFRICYAQRQPGCSRGVAHED